MCIRIWEVQLEQEFAPAGRAARETISLVQRFETVVFSQMSTIGVTFEECSSFEELLAVNQAQQHTGWFPLMPMFRPDRFVGGDAFWLRGIDHCGDVVMTEGARVYRLADTLHEEFTSLRWLYGEAAIASRGPEACVCQAPSAREIVGTVVMSGAGWVRPDYRGKGFARLVPPLIQALGYLRWDSDFTIAVVDPAMVPKGLVWEYGFAHAEDGIIWLNSPEEGDVALSLIWMTTNEMLADIKRRTESAAKGPVQLK